MAATTLINNGIETLVEQRKKDGAEKIAPQIVTITTTLGKRTTTGYRYETDGGCVFDFNELTGVIIVSIGPNDQFAANVETNKCTVYRKGSWLRNLEVSLEKIKHIDVHDTKHKMLERFRDVFGI